MAVSVSSQKADVYQSIRGMGFSARLGEVIYAPYAKKLLDKLDTPSGGRVALSHDIFADCIAYLSLYSHSRLQMKLTEKLEALQIDDVKHCLTHIVQLSTESAQSSLITTCQKVMSLDLFQKLYPTDVLARARQDRLVAPKNSSGLQQFSQDLRRYVDLNSGYVGKITRFFSQTILLSYKIDLDNPPQDQWRAQNQLTTLRTLVSDVCIVGALVAAYFPSYLAITAVAVASFVTLAAVAYVYIRFNLGTPETLSSLYGTNLNVEAKKLGLDRQTIGRVDEMHRLEEQLSSTVGSERYVPILLGPPGSGKTQLMQGLALKIVKGEVNKALLGKQILLVNSQTLAGGVKYDQSEGTTNRLELLFKSLKGFEDQFILFFDEAHTLGTKSGGSVFEGGGTNHLEDLKTKVLTSGIQCVFATTTQEYEQSIALNPALVSRLKEPITLEALSDEDVIRILKIKYKGQSVRITDEAYKAMGDIVRRVSKVEQVKALIQPFIKPLGELKNSPAFVKKLACDPRELRNLLREFFGGEPRGDRGDVVKTVKKSGLLAQLVAIANSESLNPRIADQVLDRAVNHVKAYRPQKLEQALKKAHQESQDQLKILQEQMDSDYQAWGENREGQERLKQLQAKEQKLDMLFEEQNKRVKFFAQLNDQLFEAKKRCHQLVHLIEPDQGNLGLQKEYLFLRYVVIPALEKQKKSVLGSFNSDFGEYNEPMLEQVVTVEVLKKLNPES
jgi:ATP-dependent Clp protease ATP-binding subunit ClpA